MAASVFELGRGATQQRVPFGAGYGYQLGHGSHLDVRLDVGDRHDVEQEFLLASQCRLVRARVVVETVDDGSGVEWTFSAALNGTVHYTRTFVGARSLVLDDVAIRMTDADAPPTTNTIRYRLERSA